MNVPLRLPGPAPRGRLTAGELQALRRWINDSTLPAWRGFTPAGDGTPIDALNRLLDEHEAISAVLDLVGDFAGDLSQLLQRLNGKEPTDERHAI